MEAVVVEEEEEEEEEEGRAPCFPREPLPPFPPPLPPRVVVGGVGEGERLGVVGDLSSLLLLLLPLGRLSQEELGRG